MKIKYTVICPLCPEGDRIRLVLSPRAKGCAIHQRRIAARTWSQKNRAKRADYRRTFLSTHEKQQREYKRQYYLKNRDERLRWQREYNERNRETISRKAAERWRKRREESNAMAAAVFDRHYTRLALI